MYIHIYFCCFVYTHIHTHAHTYIQTHMYMHICVYTYIYMYLRIYIYIYITPMYVCTYICILTTIYIHMKELCHTYEWKTDSYASYDLIGPPCDMITNMCEWYSCKHVCSVRPHSLLKVASFVLTCVNFSCRNTHTHTHTYTHTHTHVYIDTCVYAYMFSYIYVYVLTHIYIYISHLCMYFHIYVYTQKYTYIWRSHVVHMNDACTKYLTDRDLVRTGGTIRALIHPYSIYTPYAASACGIAFPAIIVGCWTLCVTV